MAYASFTVNGLLQGWQCPNCGKAHAPDVKTCPEPTP
jgi:uncharacterized OB-fold protein